MNNKALLLNIRWLGILLAVGLVQLDSPANLSNGLLVGTFCALIISNLVFMGRPEETFTNGPAWLFLALFDIGAYSVLIHDLDAVQGDAFYLYLPVVAWAACIQGERGIFAAVSMALAAYMGVVYTVLPEGDFTARFAAPQGILFRSLVLLMVGVFFGFLSRNLQRQVVGQQALTEERDDLEAVVAASHGFSTALKQSEVLELMIKQVTRLVGAFRCSVVHVDDGADTGTLLMSRELLAAGERPRNLALRIDLANYPEIKEALKRRGPVLVPHAADSKLMAPVLDKLEEVQVQSLMVLPITLGDPLIGTQLLCMARRETHFTKRDVRVCDLIANVSGNALRNAYVHESLSNENVSLQRLAISDPLTGLYNRRFFDMRLSEEFRLAARHDLPLSLIMMDVDHFKGINDTYGHPVGDRVLKEMARVLQDALRQSDCMARYGGEEFVVLLPLTDREGAEAKAEELRLAVRETIHQVEGKPLRVTMSFGVSSYAPDTCGSADVLVAMADHAVYMAKNRGRNQVCFFDGGHSAPPTEDTPRTGVMEHPGGDPAT
ncbi:MAG: diguanylate cyclase [Leptospirillia bacterium]